MPAKQRRLACDSAILAKLQSGAVLVIDELKFDSPKTKDFSAILNNLKIDRSCLVSIGQADENIYKSARNIPKVTVQLVRELNAGDICNRQKLLFTKDAFLSLISKEESNN